MTDIQPHLLLAQVAPDNGMGIQFFLMMGGVMLLMYALLIRPQQRQQSDQQAMLRQIERGDQIVTSGGIHGRVIGIADDVLTVEIAEKVRIKLNRSAVQTRQAVKQKNGEKKE